MKALSVTQPWAHLILDGCKTIETRTWDTTYRGDLLICATKEKSANVRWWAEHFDVPFGQLVFGHALCVVDFYVCRPMTTHDEKAACCEVTPGRYAWLLRNVRRVDPFPVKGRLGLFDVDFQLPASGHQPETRG